MHGTARHAQVEVGLAALGPEVLVHQAVEDALHVARRGEHGAAVAHRRGHSAGDKRAEEDGGKHVWWWVVGVRLDGERASATGGGRVHGSWRKCA